MGLDQGPEYASIDVDDLEQAVADLESCVTGLEDGMPGLDADFTYFGVSRSHLDTLLEAKDDLAAWLPAMRRRLSLAVQRLATDQETGQSMSGTIVFTGDLTSSYETVEDAQAAGQAMADELADNGGVLTEEMRDELQANSGDPDYTEAFINGASREDLAVAMADASARAGGYSDDGDDSYLQALASVMATASYRVEFDRDFIESINQGLIDAQLPGPAVQGFDLMTEMMQHGAWSHESLAQIANVGIEGGDLGWLDDETWAQMYSGLARNPQAAATVFSEHEEDVLNQLRSPRMGTEQPLADFVEAATVGADSIYFRIGLYDEDAPNLAQQNASALIQHVAGTPPDDGFPDEFDGVFIEVTEHYWDDYVSVFGSVGGTATYPDGTPVPVDQIPRDQWDAFIERTLAGGGDNPGRVMNLFQNEMEEQRERRDLNNDGNPSGVDGYSIGALGNTFEHLWNRVNQQHDLSEEEAAERREAAIDWVINAAFDPKGIPETVAKETLGRLFDGLLDNAAEQEPLPELDTSAFGDYASYQQYAADALGRGDIRPYDDGTVTWDGDPEFYEELYGGEFTDESGNILPLEDIRSDPEALEAYNNWLRDPAVQNSVSSPWQDEVHSSTGG